MHTYLYGSIRYRFSINPGLIIPDLLRSYDIGMDLGRLLKKDQGYAF